VLVAEALSVNLFADGYVLAYMPAALLLAMRAYVKAHPSTSEHGDNRLGRGLTLGFISALSLPTIMIGYSFANLQIPIFSARILLLTIAAAGNVLNFYGVRDCLQERNGRNLLVAGVLLLIQLLWLGLVVAVWLGGS
jgi:hypothetical protein